MGAVIKTINDYYEQLFKEYPDVPKSDIKRILQYGYKSLYLHNSFGGDVMLERGNFWFYCGNLCKDGLKHFQYYTKKLLTKLRVLYKRNKIEWDGYYYFALSQAKYDFYKAQQKKRGRPRKKFTFTNIILRKLYDEVLLKEINGVAIFRIPVISDIGYSKFYYTLTTDKAELVTEKEHTRMRDIMTSCHEYKILKNKKYKK